MLKIKLILVILATLVFSFRIWQSTGCQEFFSFHFNPLIIKINVESQVLLDSALERNISRFFHNKVTVGVFEVTKSFVFTFNPRFLLGILGPAGLVLITLNFYKLFNKRNIINTSLFGLVLAVSFFNIIFTSPKFFFYLAAISWYLFALTAINYLTSLKSKVILIVLIFLTFWYFIFSWEMNAICQRIFFR